LLTSQVKENGARSGCPWVFWIFITDVEHPVFYQIVLISLTGEYWINKFRYANFHHSYLIDYFARSLRVLEVTVLIW